MVLSLHPLLKSLALPLVTAILATGLAAPSLGSDIWQWSGWEWPGWSAVEAAGTFLAFLAVIYLAWREGSKERRRLSGQRKTIRLLLYQEIAANQEEIAREKPWTVDWSNKLKELVQEGRDPTQTRLRSISDLPEAPDARMPVVAIREQLFAQLDLYSLCLDANEVEKINAYYDTLHGYWELRAHSFDSQTTISTVMEWLVELGADLSLLETIGDELLNLLHKE